MVEASFKLGVISALAYGVLMPLALRVFWKATPLAVFFSSALIIHLIGTIVLVAYMPGCPYWHGAAFFWFFFMAYLYGFNALYKSISIDLIGRLAESPGHQLPYEELCKIVESHFVARTRLLVDSRYVDVVDNAYFPTASGRDLASRIRKAQKIFGIEVSGLYSAW